MIDLQTVTTGFPDKLIYMKKIHWSACLSAIILLCISFLICGCVEQIPGGREPGDGNGKPGGDENPDGGNDNPGGEPDSECDQIVILFTNDLHSQIEPLDPDSQYNAGKGGVARIKVLVDSVKAAEKAVIVADAGDFVQGSFYFTCLDGDVEMAVQKEIGYDIRTIGNHEFDKKIPGLAHMLSLNDVMTVSSNYDFSATVVSENVRPSVLLERGGRKIGFIGLGPRLSGLVDPKSCEGVIYSYPWEDADRLAAELKKQGAEMVIALSHLGYNATSTAKYYDRGFAMATENIDFIIGGHSHTFLTKADYATNLAGTEVPIVQTGSRGIYLGYMKIDFTRTGRSRYSYRLIPVNSRLDSRIDPAFDSMLAGWAEDLGMQMNEVLGYCPRTMRKGVPQGLLGNWAADALVEICRETFGTAPDLAICNNGGLRTELTPGDVRRKDIYAVFPFDNRLCLLELQGTVLLQMFDDIAAYNGEPVSADVSLRIKDKKVESVTVGGMEIVPDKTYRVCTIDYLSNSDHYHLGRYISREDSEEFVYDLVCDYVKRLTEEGKKVESQIDGRITVK